MAIIKDFNNFFINTIFSFCFSSFIFSFTFTVPNTFLKLENGLNIFDTTFLINLVSDNCVSVMSIHIIIISANIIGIFNP